MQFTQPIRQNFEFRRLYYRGKCGAGPLVAIYCLKNRLGHNRLGITVGGKLGNAVTRNRVRRRISESYRLMESELNQGFDIVIVARSKAVTAEYRQINAEIRSKMKKLGLLEKAPI